MENFLKGALLSGSMIIAIGGQNAFVLKQGLLQRHIFWVSLTCFLCDALLITVGVMGLGSMITGSRMASIALSLGGGGFLIWYGIRSFDSALRSTSVLEVGRDDPGGGKARQVILATLAVTLLNPHVYLDTVVVVGGVAGTLLLLDHKIQFLVGALLASGCWFFGLGYGAKLLVPFFKSARAWRILDLLIGCFMVWIAFQLLGHGIALIRAA
ncbi:Lysine exporter protein [Azotobacter vinelandii CA]|uniref:Lysine exporter protein n=2 Tax=Azotobacter vinelandii TaxID=354 RepID=C1DJQ8_AZOVD|nr:Lysine exporter protein [Azotobacter vinelandii DJ]AGK13691.1 Lysine exporter protein [Azotobacter vinelandii CA]AGK18242.1 Lysine exporter protein [Azotobacter vinelandii CA6]GLK60067.1 amino acid transporter [Azotobacter vinelandii]SFX31839.1 L-lysine exporter family protein LysE/ArgO [Azotobacter vinelandii]